MEEDRKKEGGEKKSLLFSRCRMSSYMVLSTLISERLNHFLGMAEL